MVRLGVDRLEIGLHRAKLLLAHVGRIADHGVEPGLLTQRAPVAVVKDLGELQIPMEEALRRLELAHLLQEALEGGRGEVARVALGGVVGQRPPRAALRHLTEPSGGDDVGQGGEALSQVGAHRRIDALLLLHVGHRAPGAALNQPHTADGGRHRPGEGRIIKQRKLARLGGGGSSGGFDPHPPAPSPRTGEGEFGKVAGAGTDQRVAAAQMVVEERERAALRRRRQPERELRQIHRQRVEIHTVDATLGDAALPIGQIRLGARIGGRRHAQLKQIAGEIFRRRHREMPAAHRRVEAVHLQHRRDPCRIGRLASNGSVEQRAQGLLDHILDDEIGGVVRAGAVALARSVDQNEG